MSTKIEAKFFWTEFIALHRIMLRYVFSNFTVASASLSPENFLTKIQHRSEILLYVTHLKKFLIQLQLTIERCMMKIYSN